MACRRHTGRAIHHHGWYRFSEAGNDGKNLQYQFKSTNLAGGHALKYGILYEDVAYSQLQQVTGPAIMAHDGRRTATGAVVTALRDVSFGSIYRVLSAAFLAERDTHQDYLSFFVQDSWRASGRLTINAGVRYDQESLRGTFARLQVLDGGFVDDFSLKNNWAPRVGGVYDLLGDGRSKLFANYGRFFARMPNDLAARGLSAEETISRGDYFDAGLSRPIPDGVVTQTPDGTATTQHFITPGAGEARWFIDPKARLSYKDEVVAGFEWEAFRNTSLGIRYSRRHIGRVL